MEFKYFHNILFTKVREVKSPSRGTAQSAGIDFYMPQIDEKFIEDFLKKNEGAQVLLTNEYMMILPGERALIPSGIRVWIENPETALIAANKSGVATQKGLIFTAQVVNSDYTGEVHLGVYNTSKFPVVIHPDEKVLQFLHMPIFFSDLKEMDNQEYDTFTQHFVETERGEGGFGSTDQKEPEQGTLFPETELEQVQLDKDTVLIKNK